jgi:hypothetical protein
MKVLGLIGMLLAFAVIILIDMPKLKATANKKKYTVVYYTVIAVGIIIGVLNIFNAIPDYNKNIVFFFQKISGVK